MSLLDRLEGAAGVVGTDDRAGTGLSPLLEAVPDAIVVVDQEGTVVQVNSQTEGMFGYPRDKLIGQRIEILLAERSRERHRHLRDQFTGGLKTRSIGPGLDLWGMRQDGSEFPVEIVVSPVPTVHGILVLSAIRDVSNRKRVGEELHRANEELTQKNDRQLWEYQNRLALIVDSSHDAIIGKNLDGTITHWNRGAEHIYGYEAAEVVGKPIMLLAPEDSQDEIPKMLADIRTGRKVEHFETVRVTKDGRHLNVSISISPIYNATGEIIGASTIARDLTEQRKAEDQLRQSQKMEAVGRLAGGIATALMAVLLLFSVVGFGQQGTTRGSDNLAPAAAKDVTSTAAGHLSFDSIGSDGQYTHVSSGVGFRYIGTYSVERLNEVLTSELSEFTSFKAEYPPARYPVKLYRIIYHSVIPEQNNRPTIASGLIAIPETGLPTMPLVSYQHGTVFTKTAVPSHPNESMETRLMIAEFAGQGYVVIGADYFGKGLSPEADSYLVKASTQQACLDMLFAARAVGSALKVQFGPLFLSGWSQGGWSTMVFLNKLDSLGISVKAAAIASAPNDLFAILNRWMHAPAAIDAVYLPALIALQANAYEEYYQLPGLAASAIKAEYLQTSRDLYLNKLTWEQAQPKLPKRLNDLLRSDFINASSVGDTRFYRIVQDSQDYRWRSATPLHTYYGDIDEVVPSYIATLPVQYQEIMGGATVTAVDAGNLANHRGTFVYGVADQKKWFDQLISK